MPIRAGLVLLCAFTAAQGIQLGAGAGYGSHAVSHTGSTRTWGGISAGLNVDVPVGPVHITPAVSLWRWSETEQVLGVKMTSSITLISPAVGVRKYFELPLLPLVPYAGAHAAMNLRTVRVEAEGLEPLTDTERDFGVGVLAGAAYMVAPNILIPVQAGYDRIFAADVNSGIIAFRAGVLLSL